MIKPTLNVTEALANLGGINILSSQSEENTKTEKQKFDRDV